MAHERLIYRRTEEGRWIRTPWLALRPGDVVYMVGIDGDELDIVQQFVFDGYSDSVFNPDGTPAVNVRRDVPAEKTFEADRSRRSAVREAK